MDNGKRNPRLSIKELEGVLKEIARVKVGVIGDACIDIYWEADMSLSELSRETPHFPLPVVKERMSLGAGGNVAANLKALGAGNVYMATLIGDDWRGRELLRLLDDGGIGTEHAVLSQTVVTPAYCKPLRKGTSALVYEDPRLDFENRSALSPKDEAMLLEQLEIMIPRVDIIAVCDQFKYGVITENIRLRLCEAACTGKTVVVDSRDRIGLFNNVIIKPNKMEAVRVVLPDTDPESIDETGICSLARQLSARTGRPLVITLGERGALWADNDNCELIPAPKIPPPVDTVGAGDTFMAAFCVALAAGLSGFHAVFFANIASGVTVRKIGTTGTASPSELMDRYREDFHDIE